MPGRVGTSGPDREEIQIRSMKSSAVKLFALLLPLVTPALVAAESAPPLHEITRRASEIDPRAREHPEIDFVFADAKGKVLDLQHAVVAPGVPSRDRLVLWLMGHSGGLAERVASYGMNYLQVSYANRWFSKLTKEQHDHGDTIGRIRLEAATGEDHSPLVAIPRPDSLEERAFQFVKALHEEGAPGAWGRFLAADGKGLDWEKVILSGSSHGSTTSARLAIHRRVDRVVMFSGPRDQTERWQALPSATPANRFFGFTHVLDTGWTGDHYCRSWQLLGLQEFGPVVDVDAVGAPFGNSRRLVTDADVGGDAKRAHGASVPGRSAVKNASGEFLHEAVWRYLFTHPVDSVGDPVPPDADCEMGPR